MILITPALDSDTTEILRLFQLNRATDGKKVWYRFTHGRRRSEHWDVLRIYDEPTGPILGFIHWAQKADNSRTIYNLVIHPDHNTTDSYAILLVQYIGRPAVHKASQPSELFERLGFTPSEKGNQMQYTLEREPAVIPEGMPWILTYTGKVVNPLDLKSDDICIEDIAHHLALVNRFAGGTAKPITVAQHSVYVSRLCDDTPYRLQALLHDASEAYLGDVTKWIKPALPAYLEAEDRAQRVILMKFGCDPEIHEEIWRADRVMVMFEGPRGFGRAWTGSHLVDRPGYEPITPEEMEKIGRWAPWNWRASEEAFLVRYRSCIDRN